MWVWNVSDIQISALADRNKKFLTTVRLRPLFGVAISDHRLSRENGIVAPIPQSSSLRVFPGLPAAVRGLGPLIVS